MEVPADELGLELATRAWAPQSPSVYPTHSPEARQRAHGGPTLMDTYSLRLRRRSRAPPHSVTGTSSGDFTLLEKNAIKNPLSRHLEDTQATVNCTAQGSCLEPTRVLLGLPFLVSAQAPQESVPPLTAGPIPPGRILA